MEQERSTKTHLILTIIFAIIGFFAVFGIFCAHDKKEGTYTTVHVKETQERVYVTSTGDCYHSASCQYLYNSSIPIGKKQAKDSGYRVCTKCGGKSSGTIQVDYTTKVKTNEPRYGAAVLIGLFCGAPVGGGLYLIAFAVIDNIKDARSTTQTTGNTATTFGNLSSTTKSGEKPQVTKTHEENPYLLPKRSTLQIDAKPGDKVASEAYGVGEILVISGGYMTVEFNGSLKTFQFPDAFEKYLKLVK